MLQVYKDNPKLGNANDVDSEIVIYTKKCEVLNQQLAKYKAMLSEAQTELNIPISVIGYVYSSAIMLDCIRLRKDF
ncbi:unnamed protein product [Onchocerca flexuosa]|uniref:TOCA HR1 domain-containing protein n=1 Tax=Onchocerca flexuosa TaxID=387005 RepID=A0A183HXD3_9BILA|nr:unnamed protein product [Onchocerca flexuosa]